MVLLYILGMALALKESEKILESVSTSCSSFSERKFVHVGCISIVLEKLPIVFYRKNLHFFLEIIYTTCLLSNNFH